MFVEVCTEGRTNWKGDFLYDYFLSYLHFGIMDDMFRRRKIISRWIVIRPDNAGGSFDVILFDLIMIDDFVNRAERRRNIFFFKFCNVSKDLGF